MNNPNMDAAVSPQEVTEFGPCIAPSTLPADPLLIEQSIRLKSHPLGVRPLHMFDADVNLLTENIFMVGTGGLYAFTKQANGSYDAVGAINQPRTFDKIELYQDTYLALTTRNAGLSIVDASNPSNLSIIQDITIENPSGAAATDTHLFVTSMSGRLHVFDISNPRSPQAISDISGLANPWEIIINGTTAYVADNTLGVVTIDISTPSAPVIKMTTETLGGAQDLTIQDHALYVAVGGAGIQIFDITDSNNPSPAGVISYGSPVVNISSHGGYIWAVNHEDVIVLGVEDEPLSPIAMGKQKTSEWALGVANIGAMGFVANWSYFESYRLDAQIRAPEVDVSRSEIYFDSTTTEEVIEIANRGSSTMSIVGANIDDPRFTLRADRLDVEPGESARFTLSYANDGLEVNTSFCVATNDPDGPIQTVNLQTSANGAGFGIGDQAINFILPDVKTGQTYELSAQLGKPVVLIYFATW